MSNRHQPRLPPAQAPNGDLADGDLELVSEEIPELSDGQALVRTQLLSLDPTNRIWMSDIRGYMPPVPIDAVMRGIGVGEVIESRRDDMPVGATVSGFVGWQELVLADDSLLEAPLSGPARPAAGAALGLPRRPRPHRDHRLHRDRQRRPQGGRDDRDLGGLRRRRLDRRPDRRRGGARVVGIAGGPEKCAHAVEKLGYDVCVDHRADDWREQLDAATPDGIDVDFENVGGPIMDHILGRLNIGARVSLCGMIAEYNTYNEGGEHSGGLTNIGQLIMQRATIQGFLVLDYADRFEEAINHLAGMLGAGKLQLRRDDRRGRHRGRPPRPRPALLRREHGQAPGPRQRLSRGALAESALTRVIDGFARTRRSGESSGRQARQAQGDAELELALGHGVAEQLLGAVDAVGDGVGVDAEAARGARRSWRPRRGRRARVEARRTVASSPAASGPSSRAAKRRADSTSSTISASSASSGRRRGRRRASPRSWTTRRAAAPRGG